MITNKLLSLLVVVGLTAGCATRVSSPCGTGPAPLPSPLSTQTGVSETAPANETPETPVDRVTPDVPLPVERRPPAVEDHSPPTPVETARVDLAHRLHTDIFLIDVVKVVAQEPDAEVMPCLAGDAVPEELWVSLSEVQWISLSVKGNVHRYVALGDLIIYCGETLDDRQ